MKACLMYAALLVVARDVLWLHWTLDRPVKVWDPALKYGVKDLKLWGG